MNSSLAIANNQRLQITGSAHSTYNSRTLLADLIRHCYKESRFAEVVGVAKKLNTTSTAEITVTGFQTKEFLIASPPILGGIPTIITDMPTLATHSQLQIQEALSTSILVRGLNIQYAQI